MAALAPQSASGPLAGLGALRDGAVLMRVFLALLSAAVIWGVTEGWKPPFTWRTRQVPSRDVLARLEFPNPLATEDARERARRQVRAVFSQDDEPLIEIRQSLIEQLKQVRAAARHSELDPSIEAAFALTPAEGSPPPTDEEREAAFQRLRATVAEEESEQAFVKAMEEVFSVWEEDGLLLEVPPELELSEPREIAVHKLGRPTERHVVKINDVILSDGNSIRQRLAGELGDAEIAERVFLWLWRRGMPSTLTYNAESSEVDREAAAAAVAEMVFAKGQVLVKAGEPIDEEGLRILRWEYEASVATLSWRDKALRSLATLGLLITVYSLCGVYIYYRERGLFGLLGRFAAVLAMAAGTIGLSRFMAVDAWRAEMIPLLLMGMTLGIVFQQELALLLSTAVALILALVVGQSLGEFIVLSGVVTSAILQVGRIRSRSKLVFVGLLSGCMAFLLTLIVGQLEHSASGWRLLVEAGRNGLWAVATGFLMTGLLPFIERAFGVLTDISLLEMTDVAHPLLQELVRRAPGTYNHSISVASLAESAAEAIGARGLLVRVGAYFHDIGKMFKPMYFAENIGDDPNRHEGLVPAMSTLIIVAHVKDGADLARQHHMPQPIVDFIEQHHGTTLVEYFYRRASQQSESDPGRSQVDESAFRYPGPKPQTREAGILMLADAVESACRALAEPTASAIEKVVNELSMRRLLDGQFDESGLTLEELHDIQASLIKSVSAVYHARVKYPDQRTAG